MDSALRPSSGLGEGNLNFRLLVESVVDYAIFMLDPSGRVATWNAGAERIKGYRADEIVGRHFSVFYSGEDVASGKCERELAEATSVGRIEDEGWRLRKGGSRFWASVVITALRDDSGTLVGFAKVTRDLTERREAEEQRIRLARAEGEAFERTRLLDATERAYRESQEANYVKDQFLATVSHELRTPLNAILGWATLMKNRDVDVEKAIETIERNARAQARIVDDVLDAARMITGKLSIEARACDLSALLRASINVVAPVASMKSISLSLDIQAETLPFFGDADRLHQVFWNLLSNAVKFTPNGGRVEVRLARAGSAAIVTVSDTGRGITKEFLPHVFERFRQGDVTTTRTERGLGLGLAIVRHLVELHGGSVQAESAGPGKGSTFTVRLPIRAIAAATGHSEQSAVNVISRPLSGVRVLLCEDEDDSRDLASDVLTRAGATVLATESASETLARLKEFAPDVLVSDIGLPGVDGYEPIGQLRSLPEQEGGGTPAIALTAYAGVEDARRAFRAGFQRHVAKPVDPSRLVDVIYLLVNE